MADANGFIGDLHRGSDVLAKGGKMATSGGSGRASSVRFSKDLARMEPSGTYEFFFRAKQVRAEAQINALSLSSHVIRAAS